MAKYGKYQGISTFTASQGWCTRFLRKNAISLRQRTKIAQKLSSEFEEKVMDFQHFVINKQKTDDFPLRRIGNIGEAPMRFDMPSNETLNQKGDKMVLIKTKKREKSHFGVGLSCIADGVKLPPMVIFKRKTPPKDKFPSGVVIHQLPKG